jgi:hypothetical protein
VVVPLHGFPDSWRLWRHQLPTLAKAGHRHRWARGSGGLDDVGSRVDDDRDVDIAADRVRIGTHRVRLGNDLLSLVAIEFWQAGAQLDGEPYPPDPSGPMPTRAVTEAPLA